MPHSHGPASTGTDGVLRTSWLRRVSVACLLGILIGVLVASLELAYLVAAGYRVYAKDLALPMVSIYGLLTGLVGLCVGLAGCALSWWLRGLADGIKCSSLCLALLIGGWLAMETGAALERHAIRWPGGFASGLAVGLAVTVVTLGVSYMMLVKALSALENRGWLRPRRLPLLGVVWCSCAIIAAAAITWAPRQYGDNLVVSGGSRDRPDVFIILVDAMRPDHMSLHGYERETTPAIDRLSREGAVFLDAHAQSSWTRATVPTIFTSLWPWVSGVEFLEDTVPAEAVTLPEVFKREGYDTAVFSANYLVSPMFGYGEGTSEFVTPRYPTQMVGRSALGCAVRTLEKRAHTFERLRNVLETTEAFLGGQGSRPTILTAEEINRHVLEWAKSSNAAPLFAYLHYMEPHTPYGAPAPFDTLFASSGHVKHLPMPPPPRRLMAPFGEGTQVSDDERQGLISAYDASLCFVDSCIGSLIEHLLLVRGDNMIVVVTADHGEEFYEHKGWRHGASLYEEVLKIPLIFWWPRRIPGGLRAPGLVRQIDVFPTLLELCEIPPVDSVSGTSLAPVLLSERESVRPCMSLSRLKRGETAESWAIQNDLFKLIVASHRDETRLMLFDLLADPDETEDISNAMPHKASEMLAALKLATSGTQVASLPKGVPAMMDEEAYKILRSLGYID